ncbi:nucleotidyl transferase AbiEii/AbiGii toxin family protein [Acrocarpospora catenulata]|uniref:nucleotidyl transferase AbiEii/AbiGii toxin family protein n=1 Tax=Acrocarpospora catenulata TaxID=2836182 RepID=UPI001BD95767|nr:nucleotidyl transferase AbiEii/AbiGii toxin family protein [Acrocarpospora catenulata]
MTARTPLAPFYQRVLDLVFDAEPGYGLCLTGAYALRAHGLVDRPSRGLDFVTVSETPLGDIADGVADRLRADGLDVKQRPGTPLVARMIASEPVTEQSCPVNLLKEPLQRPPVIIDDHPVADLDDIVGMKVGAVLNRALPRDLIDVAAVSEWYAFPDLERLGALFEDGFNPQELAFKLETAQIYDDEAYAEYGLDKEQATKVRRFALLWYEDLSMRLAEEADIDSYE